MNGHVHLKCEQFLNLLRISILKYFKLEDNASLNALPDPEGPVSTAVPSEAIAIANKKVRDVLDKSSDGKRLQGALSNTDISQKAINWPESCTLQDDSHH